MKIAVLAVWLLILTCTSASTYAVERINGISVHSELGQESFVAALFTTTLSTSAREILVAQEEKQIQVRVLAKRISARRFKRMWIEGLAINASASELQTHSQNMANFSNMIRVSLRSGDIFAVQRSNADVRVIINGTTLGIIEDTGFFDLLLRAWIGPVPLSSQFRKDLLAGGKFSPVLQNQFNQTRPSDQRIDAVAQALAGVAVNQQSNEAVAQAPRNIPKIAPPKIAPPVVQPTRTPAQPTVTRPQVTPTPRPTAVARAKPTPTPKPPVVAAKPKFTPKPVAPPPRQAEEESILEDDNETFTAESLLAQQLYIAKLKTWTYRELLYPQRSLENEEQGGVRLSVTINRAGKVIKLKTIEESEHFRLTKAALVAVRKSSPYPSIPESMAGDTFTFSLPIVFRIVD